MKKILTPVLLFTLFNVFLSHAQTLVVDSFYYTGSTQTFVIPQCASNLSLMIHGARGGYDPGEPGRTGGFAPGDGGRIYVVMSPTTGAQLYINVGGGGKHYFGGWNGGGNGGAGIKSTGGGGGGGTDIRIGGNSIANRIFVAGGGGGGGGGSGFGTLSTGLHINSTSNYGGGGGGIACSGLNTTTPSCPSLLGCSGETGNPPMLTGCSGLTLTGGGVNGGGGGMISGGGAASYTGGCSGTSGSLFQGGIGADSTCTSVYQDRGRFGGGGGGGGYYGGGGGFSRSIMASQFSNDNGGGGGGSTYLDGSFVLTYSLYGYAGIQSPTSTTVIDGVVTFSYYVNGPGVNASASQNSICAGQALTLTAAGVNSYTWLPATGFSGSNNATVNVSPGASTHYTVIGLNSFGCTSQTVVSVQVNVTPALQVSPVNPAICPGDSVSLSANGASFYNWSNGQNSSSIKVSPSSSAIYTVTGSNSATSMACSASTSVQVVVYPVPVLTLSANRSPICAGETVTLSAGGALSYTWSVAGNSPIINYGTTVISPTNSLTYSVTGVAANSCKAQSTVSVEVQLCAGINEMDESHFKLFPNPTKGSFYANSPVTTQLVIYSSLGQLIQKTDLVAGEIKEIHLAKTGVYYIQFLADGKQKNFKLLVLD